MASWPGPYFVADTTPSSQLDLIITFSGVTLYTEGRGEIKNGTLLIGRGVVYFRREDRSLLRLTVLWSSRKPELHASAIRLNPRIDLFLEAYSFKPDFVLYFSERTHAHAAFESLFECAQYPPPYFQVAQAQQRAAGDEQRKAGSAALPAMGGLARIVEQDKRQIQEEQKLTTEAFSDLTELMSKAEQVMQLVKKCAESLQNNASDMNEFDRLLSEIGIVDNPVTKVTAGKEYHNALAKQISDFFSQRKPPLAVITLQDVYALYNKARGGVELVSPSDVLAACRLMRGDSIELNFELVEYANGLKAIKNKRVYGDIEKACQSLLVGPSGCLTAADLVKSVPHLPLVVAKEWLMDKEHKGELLRDRDAYGNLRWFANRFDEFLKMFQ